MVGIPEMTEAETSSGSYRPSAAPSSVRPSSSARPVGPHRPFHWRGATGRLAVSVIVGIAAGLLLSDRQSWAASTVGAWDCGSFTLLALNWQIIWTADAEATKRRAGASDPGRTAAWVLALVASCFSLFAGSVVVRHASSIDPERSPLLIALCLIAVGSAWSLTHTSYALRYAHLFYRENDSQGGLTFPGDANPDDFDFAYFAFTVGMTFQASDISITSPLVRRTVLAHSILSFAYNTVIIALMINVLSGVLN